EGAVAEVLDESLGKASNREIADARITPARADLFRRVRERVVGGVERIDALETEERTVLQSTRCVELPPFEHGLQDVERRGPGARANRGSRLCERLCDRPAVS